jgi:polyisoprenoid-binding protein YceI
MTLKINVRRRFSARAILAVFGALVAFAFAPSSNAQEAALRIDPQDVKIEYSLGSTLHTVHGTFALKSSAIQFDPTSGKISGAIVVDATSGQSGNNSRDSRMHREILESAKFPEIVFTPEKFTGALASSGVSKVEVSGRFHLHGKDHDVTLPVEVVAEGQKLQVAIHFVIPYVEWGLKNPSNFFLRASDKVEIDIHATGHIESASAER